MVKMPAIAQTIAGTPKSVASVNASKIVPMSPARCGPRLASQAVAVGVRVANAAKATADHKYPFIILLSLEDHGSAVLRAECTTFDFCFGKAYIG
jgi:hypothetical protein